MNIVDNIIFFFYKLDGKKCQCKTDSVRCLMYVFTFGLN